MRMAIRDLPGVQYVAAGVNTRGQIVAGNLNWGTQVQGTDVDLPLIRSWPATHGAFFAPVDVATASKVAVLGSVVQRSAVRRRRRSGRPGHSHQQPAVHRRRRDGEQGPVRHGPGPGRCDLRAVHDGDEEAARHHVHPERHGVGGDGGRHQPAPPNASRSCCAVGTRWRSAIRTTSWCARWRKWPACACRPPRR